VKKKGKEGRVKFGEKDASSPHPGPEKKGAVGISREGGARQVIRKGKTDRVVRAKKEKKREGNLLLLAKKGRKRRRR